MAELATEMVSLTKIKQARKISSIKVKQAIIMTGPTTAVLTMVAPLMVISAISAREIMEAIEMTIKVIMVMMAATKEVIEAAAISTIEGS